MVLPHSSVVIEGALSKRFGDPAADNGNRTNSVGGLKRWKALDASRREVELNFGSTDRFEVRRQWPSWQAVRQRDTHLINSIQVGVMPAPKFNFLYEFFVHFLMDNITNLYNFGILDLPFKQVLHTRFSRNKTHIKILKVVVTYRQRTIFLQMLNSNLIFQFCSYLTHSRI